MHLTLSGNGIRFDMRHHERLFGLITRPVSADAFEATGPGLAITRKLVGKMGGRVYAASTPRAGATIEVELPRVRSVQPRM